MFIFNLFITIIIGFCLMLLVKNLRKDMDITNRTAEVFVAWIMGLSLLIVIRCIANIGLHYDISSNVGDKGLDGERGERGYRGSDRACN